MDSSLGKEKGKDSIFESSLRFHQIEVQSSWDVLSIVPATASSRAQCIKTLCRTLSKVQRRMLVQLFVVLPCKCFSTKGSLSYSDGFLYMVLVPGLVTRSSDRPPTILIFLYCEPELLKIYRIIYLFLVRQRLLCPCHKVNIPSFYLGVLCLRRYQSISERSSGPS